MVRGERLDIVLMEEPELVITAENVQFKCPRCDKTKQVIYVGGPRSGLMKCAYCGKALWAGKSAAIVYTSSSPRGRTSDFGRSLKEPGKAIGLRKESEQAQHERAEKTLLAIKECKRYLEDVEKELSRISKKFSNREIAQGIGFAATGIHEALTYLDIVRKVIEKTERIVAKRKVVADNETDGPSQAPGDRFTDISEMSRDR